MMKTTNGGIRYQILRAGYDIVHAAAPDWDVDGSGLQNI